MCIRDSYSFKLMLEDRSIDIWAYNLETVLAEKLETIITRTCLLYTSKGRFDMGNFTFEETNLLCIYNTGSRTGLIEALTEMCGELSPEEAELRELTDSALSKLRAMSDAEFAELELYPDFDE